MGRCGSVGWVAAIGLFLWLSTSPAAASLVARVDLSAQRMAVMVNGRHYAYWKISSGRKGYRTPTGTYRPKALRRMHYSSKYDNSPMPFSVFFTGGYAIHGTEYLKQLGRPASHGCIRLHPKNAANLYYLIKDVGLRKSRITIRY